MAIAIPPPVAIFHPTRGACTAEKPDGAISSLIAVGASCGIYCFSETKNINAMLVDQIVENGRSIKLNISLGFN